MYPGDVVTHKHSGRGVILGKTEHSYWILFEAFGIVQMGLDTEFLSWTSPMKLDFKELFETCIEGLKNSWEKEQYMQNNIWDLQGRVSDFYKELDLYPIKLKSKFTKSDLKSWMILELRNGDLLQYYPYGQLEGYENGWALGYDDIEITMDEYKDDLTNKLDDIFDIVKIHKIKNFDLFDEEDWLDVDNMELVREL